MSNAPVLFDVNAGFGKPASGGAEYPTVQDRLHAMDRLGVSRALLWNTGSAQNHAISSNQAMIDAIRRTPGATGRIFPSLLNSSEAGVLWLLISPERLSTISVG